MSERERCIDFLRDLDRRCSERMLPSRYGTVLLHQRLPRVWSRNFLQAEENLDEASAEDLARECARLLGDAGVTHRKVEVYDDQAGPRLEPGFRALAWNVECDLVMPHARDPDGRPETIVAEEVGFEALEPVWAEGIRSEPFGKDEDVVRQLIANKRAVAEGIETRFFAARVDGEIASYCDLYSDGGTAQIEAVMTLERYRNRGLARAVVLRALAASRKAGNDLTFLLALRDDWPKHLYRKLGFDEIGRIYQFTLPSGR